MWLLFLALGLVNGQGSIPCPATDLIILLDGSSSLGLTNFLKTVEFAKDVLTQMGLSPKGNHAVIVQYTDEVTREHEGVLTDIDTAITVANDIHYHMGASFLDTALEYAGAALKELDRQANKVVLIINDGESQTDPSEMATQLWKEGVSIGGVLVTENLVDEGDAKLLAHARSQMQETTRNHLAVVPRFSDLDSKLAKTIAVGVCNMGRPQALKTDVRPRDQASGLPQEQIELKPQNQNCIVEYGKATECSVTCGMGHKHQFGRVVQPQLGQGKPCSSLVRAIRCNSAPCNTIAGARIVPAAQKFANSPIDCEVLYGQPTQCSRSCGLGYKVQLGRIVQQAQFGGKPCPSLAIAIPCNQETCPDNASPQVANRESRVHDTRQLADALTSVDVATPVDCQVESTTFECSKSCGGGTQTVENTIVVAPENGGLECPPRSQQQPCNIQPCPEPVDCEVHYTDWSVCTKSCDEGFRVRAAHIVKEARNGGKPCPVEKFEQEPCNLKKCTNVIDFDCSQIDEGDHELVPGECGRQYVTCAVGMPYLRDCAAGLYFSPKEKVCDTWTYACGHRTRPEITTTTGSPAEITEAPVLDCNMLPEGHYPDPENKCSSFFYSCAHGHLDRRDCPQGLYYSNRTSRCDERMYVFECTGQVYVSTTAMPAPPVMPQDEPRYPIDCDRHLNGDFEHPTRKCSQIYYTCDNGRVVERTCVRGTFFAAEVVQCLQRQFVPSCGGHLPDPDATEAPQANKMIVNYPDGPDCEKMDIGNYAAGGCEHHYYTCNFGQTVRRECPTHLFYDAEFDRCELRKYMPTCGGTRPAPKTTLSPPIHEDLINCSDLKDGGYPDPALDHGCSQKYVMCANKLAFRFECPGDLYFDKESRDCLSMHEVAACQ